ncbi:glycosyltransferase [Marinibactrum halimedae]|uniref:Colanic acid biosynthesis glycosyltransferase WcaL n=1 Tax=Marinibactrum halimedae TaxID=1444977 RepID=A0AA37T3D4_9GAMM|nr:glycosyltransferase [Marinibactrum halimedae]MCD9459761.1 glycosyltransferase [Marinibactrum halimedae]GLS24482.1 colanic acid biosynthesis glycosyltransferase WcaL [Marinibactrum halimedae]
MKNSKLKIGYLAPEIPGPSSTFVYTEIFGLQRLGYDVQSYSVHPVPEPKDHSLTPLYKSTQVLYGASPLSYLAADATSLVTAPVGYLKASVLCLKDAIKNVAKPRIALGLVARFMVASRLACQLKKDRVDHLHIHFAHISADIGMYAATMCGIPFSITAHANDIFDNSWLLNEKVSRSAFFATISQFNRVYLTQRGADEEKIKIIRCGIDPSKFISREKQPVNSTFLMGFLGRLVEKKGAAILLAACKQLSDQGVDFRLEIVGGGPLQDELQAFVANNNLSDKVSFLGAMSHSEVSSWLNGLNSFVLPCVKDRRGDMDGIPVALMEAMLMGVPVISTDISGLPELVMDQQTGFVAKTESAASLAKTIERMMATDEIGITKIVSSAIELVCQEFEQAANVEKLLHLIIENNDLPGVKQHV